MNDLNTHSFSVYYDASCPMCRSEIAFYQKQRGGERINWVDVSVPDNVPNGLSCSEAMVRFHVKTQAGEFIDGGAAFAALWKQLPAFRWFGRLFSITPMRWLLNLAYNIFLPFRPALQRFFAARTAGQPDATDTRS